MGLLKIISNIILMSAIILTVIGVYTYYQDTNVPKVDTRLQMLQHMDSIPSGSTNTPITQTQPATQQPMPVNNPGDSVSSNSHTQVPITQAPDVPIKKAIIKIMNTKICHSDKDCTTSNPWPGPNFAIYWTIENGQGCCNTFYCNYETFKSFCLEPFTLYDVYYDDIKQTIDLTNYTYTCSTNTPWAYMNFFNINPGEHTIRIEQKDCINIVDTATINFNLEEDNGTYTLIQE